MNRRIWTREEHIAAFNLYCKIPFTKINSSNRDIQNLAVIIGRSAGSVAMKLANFARLDPSLRARNISGLTQGAKGEEDIWKEFVNNWEELSFESEQIISNYTNNSTKEAIDIIVNEYFPEGQDRITLAKTRINQDFFRSAVLASYNNRCCITGIAIPDLLVASHIVPWSVDSHNRANPTNGLCLNALHDKAFDNGLITVTPDYSIKFSKKLMKYNSDLRPHLLFECYNNGKIVLPQKFYPHKQFLEYHNLNIFQG